ncbi:MAG: methyltransferase [Gammaproteobacteria bacterium]|nr:methyltransferase [Gammaproteobacteria bacterium]
MVEAPINYLAAMDEKPVYFMDPPPGVPEENMSYDKFTVSIHDARRLAPPPSLEREGFEVVTHQTAVTDLYDVGAIRETYYPEMEQLVKQVTGAHRVVIFDFNIRISTVEGTEGGTPKKESDDDTGFDPEQAQPPVRCAHNDYTDLSGPQRVRDLMGKHEAEKLLQRRFAIINVWKPIRGPVQQVPLAVCDARSIAPGDLVETDLVYPDRTGEISLLSFKPAQRWFYIPEMRADEAMLLKCYDSEHDRPRFTAHSAFDDPTSDPDAPPRESIEVRTLAFF